jgi:phosphatidate cytidylyltransferase
VDTLRDPVVQRLLIGVLAVLLVATAAGRVLAARARTEAGRATVANMNERINAWWVMCGVFTLAMLSGSTGSVVLFAFVSFLALREFITGIDSTRADHRALLVAFFLATPLQYWFVGTGWYGMFTIFIPVYIFLLTPAVLVVMGETRDFLRRASSIQWALMICVYAISHAPALLVLDTDADYLDRRPLLLFWLVAVVQLSDVLQYVFGKLLGRHPIAPRVSPNKTWEGFVGGVLSATGIGTALWWATPFEPWQAALMALLVTVVGFFGGLVMAAVKRDRGVKDFGTMIPGHGGVLDRVDSLTFAAPVFFHATRYFF